MLATHFKSIGEIPVSGGWGYTVEDAVVFDKNDPLIPKDHPFDFYSLEYVFVEKRIYEELIVLRSDADRYSGIKWKLLSQTLRMIADRKYDVLKFEVTAFRDRDWEELKAEWEGPNGHESKGFDIAAHMRKRESLMTCYTTEYWFDITDFFGNPFSLPNDQ